LEKRSQIVNFSSDYSLLARGERGVLGHLKCHYVLALVCTVLTSVIEIGEERSTMNLRYTCDKEGISPGVVTHA
jgi:hypothetical protein